MQHLRFLFCQDILEYPLINTGVDGCVDSLFPAHSASYILLYLCRKFRILPQSAAFLHKRLIITAVDVQHLAGTFQTAAPPSCGKGIRKVEHQIVCLHTGTVIKDNIYGCRQIHSFRSVNIVTAGGKKPLKLPRIIGAALF